MTYVPSVIFANLPDGLNPLSLFDAQFAAIAAAFAAGQGTTTARIVAAAGPIAILATDTLVVMNLPGVGAVAAQLPTVASRAGLPLTLSDFNGNGTMTLTPDPSNTGGIQGQANWVISPFGNQTLTPNAALNGWIVTG